MRGRLQSVAILVFVPVAWGYNWVVMKKALAYAGPFEFSALRFVLASLCLFAVLFLLKRPIRVRPMSGVIWAGLLQTAGNFGLTMWALLTGPAGRSAVLCYTMPFWVVLIAWPLLGERPSRLQWLASAVACIGLALIFGASAGTGDGRAAVLSSLAGLSWGAGTVVARRLLTRSAIDPLALAAWQMLFGGLALALASVLAPGRPFVWSPYFLFVLFYTVVPASALAWLFWFALLQRTAAGLASLTLLATPVLGIVFSALELNERPAGWEILGMTLIATALLIVGPLAMGNVQWRRSPAPKF
jgi:drug/metabolite transporter (DMT)-like permease